MTWTPIVRVSNSHVFPRVNGTFVIDKLYWLCGSQVYLRLPPNWGGLCAPIHLTDHTFIVSAINATTRKQRSLINVAPHDAIHGSDVLDEHKLWSTGQKILLSAFPQFGVGKLFLRMETVDYRMHLLINATIKAINGTMTEISAMRLMVLQNRLVLDLLTAKQGGVCHDRQGLLYIYPG